MAHYRRAYAGARVMGRLSRSRLFRQVLRSMLPYTSWEASARALLRRAPDEPQPDFSHFPATRFACTSPLGAYVDAYPLQRITTASLRTLARLNPAASWDVRRFRSTLVIATTEAVEGFGGGELARVYPAARGGRGARRAAHRALRHDHPGTRRPAQRPGRIAHHRAGGGPAARHRRERGAAEVCRRGGRRGRAVRRQAYPCAALSPVGGSCRPAAATRWGGQRSVDHDRPRG